jgi:hypothetical protein
MSKYAQRSAEDLDSTLLVGLYSLIASAGDIHTFGRFTRILFSYTFKTMQQRVIPRKCAAVRGGGERERERVRVERFIDNEEDASS